MRPIRLSQWCLPLLPALLACQAETPTDDGTETHWLVSCNEDSDCGVLACLCGACTLPCESDEPCSDADLVCTTAPASCGDEVASRVCGEREPASQSGGEQTSRDAGSPPEDESGEAMSGVGGNGNAGVAGQGAGGDGGSGFGGRTDGGATSGGTAEGGASAASGSDAGGADGDAGVDGEGGSAGNGEVPEIQGPPNALGTGPLGACDDEGWCWQNPAPTGDIYFAVSDDGRYAVGEEGVVFGWPDRYLPRLEAESLYHVQTAFGGVWAAGAGLWNYDGVEWTLVSDSSYLALRVSPAGTLRGLTLDGTVERQYAEVGHLWSGQQHVPTTDPAPGTRWVLLDLMVVDEETVWVLATNFESPKAPDDGIGFLLVEERNGTWTDGPSLLPALGSQGKFVRSGSQIYVQAIDAVVPGIYDPTDWSLVVDSPPTARAVFGAPGGGLLASMSDGLYSLADAGMEKVSDRTCDAAVAVSDTELFCAGSQGLSVVTIGTSPEEEPTPGQLDANLFGVVPTAIWARSSAAWGTSATDVWRPPLDHFDGSEWTSFVADAPEGFRAVVIHGSASDDVWFASNDAIVHHDGVGISEVALPEPADYQFVSAVHSLGPSDVWAVRGNPNGVKLLHHDGVAWNDAMVIEESSFAYEQAAFAGGGSLPLWAAVGPRLYRLDGDSWVAEHTGSLSFVDLAIDETGLWALAQDAVYERVDGTLVARGRRSGRLNHLAISEDAAWHFGGTFVKTLAR